jgi:hypothetical protein
VDVFAQLVAVMCSTCTDYFHDIQPMLDPFFYERLVALVLTCICEQDCVNCVGLRSVSCVTLSSVCVCGRRQLRDEVDCGRENEVLPVELAGH